MVIENCNKILQTSTKFCVLFINDAPPEHKFQEFQPDLSHTTNKKELPSTKTLTTNGKRTKKS